MDENLGRHNPVVTSEQRITEPARSGKPNPVRTSEQDVTEPARLASRDEPEAETQE